MVRDDMGLQSVKEGEIASVRVASKRGVARARGWPVRGAKTLDPAAV